ncbi:MAG: hypothetical protein EAZ55_01830 [Cytophagales bacterium]|nr:MAG: hypothetical protein EAZ55_01830 [Cytophagales bacterium]
MKKILFPLLTLILLGYSITKTYADPEDCMSKEEAELLAKEIKAQKYIIDYCDCCADVNTDAIVTANLLLIKTATVVPCEYDDTRFSVKIEYDLIKSLEVKSGEYVGTATWNGNPIKNALLNYQFFYADAVALQLGYAVRDSYQAPSCSGLQTFPDAKWINDKKYLAWYKKK